jgi:S1-C subfamily serine protease
MSEDHIETDGQPVSGPENAETAPTPAPETTAAEAAAETSAATPTPEVTAETPAPVAGDDAAAATDLPAAVPPPPAEPFAYPGPGATPPQGTYEQTQPVTPPQGAYMGGAPYAYGPQGMPYGAPYGMPYGMPTMDPGTAQWPAPPVAPAKANDHKLRNALLAGGGALVLLAGGIGIGLAAADNGHTSLNASGASNGGRFGNGGSGNGSFPFGGGNPFGGSNGNSGGTGNSGSTGSSGNSGSSNSGGSGPSDVNSIAAKVDPGLVDINTTLGYQSEQAAGTGIVLTSNGVILTNNHVIDGATKISVTDVGNHKTYTASVVGYDRTKDIAVLQLANASGLTTAPLGNSSNLSVGQDVVGVGNAGGTGGTPSAAGGTITGLNQSITASDQGDGTSEQLTGLIQTNADIQPGDSGGSLVNDQGQVIGVDTAASAGFSFSGNSSGGNQGFAIPINTALSIARAIEAGQGSNTVHIGATAFLGVEITPTASNNSAGGFGGFFGGSGNTGSSASGASVAGVVTNGPAQEAGLAQGDTITSLGGKTIGSSDDLTNAMGIYHPGDKVQVAWTDSSGSTHSATVQLSSGPPQ